MTQQDGKRRRGCGRIWPLHRVEAVLESFKGEKSVAQICQERGIARSTFFAWREQFLKGAEAAKRPTSSGRPAHLLLLTCISQVHSSWVTAMLSRNDIRSLMEQKGGR